MKIWFRLVEAFKSYRSDKPNDRDADADEDKNLEAPLSVSLKISPSVISLFTFSAIRSIEKVLHLPKKSTSRF